MALAPLVLPTLECRGSGPGQRYAPSLRPVTQTIATPVGRAAGFHVGQARRMPVAAKPAPATLSPLAAATALYAVPAAILLFITVLALGRLVALQARADVLVDGHWLSALARAQRRMGFKHGTALLTSDELASPISWGLMRPVILLNSRAVEATGEAEAIIAHELAHVARMDWIKLLLARVATALFWFNPLVWMLAREAHQLREETADDSVLAADIVDTDYAQLLVGVARHECPGLLLGAHGVAPSKSSLARRVARVLDGKSVRGPVARSLRARRLRRRRPGRCAARRADPDAGGAQGAEGGREVRRAANPRRLIIPKPGGSDRPAEHHRRGRLDIGQAAVAAATGAASATVEPDFRAVARAALRSKAATERWSPAARTARRSRCTRPTPGPPQDGVARAKRSDVVSYADADDARSGRDVARPR